MYQRTIIVPFGQDPVIQLDSEHEPVIRIRRKTQPRKSHGLKRQVGFNREVRTWEPQGVNFDKFLAEDSGADLDHLLVVEPVRIDHPEELDKFLIPDS